MIRPSLQVRQKIQTSHWLWYPMTRGISSSTAYFAAHLFGHLLVTYYCWLLREASPVKHLPSWSVDIPSVSCVESPSYRIISFFVVCSFMMLYGLHLHYIISFIRLLLYPFVLVSNSYPVLAPLWLIPAWRFLTLILGILHRCPSLWAIINQPYYPSLRTTHPYYSLLRITIDCWLLTCWTILSCTVP